MEMDKEAIRQLCGRLEELSRRQPDWDQDALVLALIDCPSMRSQQRTAIVSQLPAHIRLAIPDNAQPLMYVTGMVRTVLNFPVGLAALVIRLQFFDGETRQFDVLVKTLRDLAGTATDD